MQALLLLLLLAGQRMAEQMAIDWTCAAQLPIDRCYLTGAAAK